VLLPVLRARVATLLCVFLKIELVRDCAKLATSCFVAPELVFKVRIIAASLEAGAGRAADKSRGSSAEGVLLAAGGSSSASCTFEVPSLVAGIACTPEEPLLAGRSSSPAGCASQDLLLAASGCSPAGCAAEDSGL
jgi:hypothetical protein